MLSSCEKNPKRAWLGLYNIQYAMAIAAHADNAIRLRSERKALGTTPIPSPMDEEARARHRASVAEYYQRYDLFN